MVRSGGGPAGSAGRVRLSNLNRIRQARGNEFRAMDGKDDHGMATDRRPGVHVD